MLNCIHEGLVKELIDSSISLGHSPKRREVPGLAWRCYKHIGSFNKAKILAGLNVENVRTIKFPKKAFKQDKDMAAIAGYLMCDGHIYKNFKGMFYSSKSLNDLKNFEELVFKKFKIRGKYYLNSTGSKYQTHSFYLFNKKVCQKLVEMGIPKGDKIIQPFSVPIWIKESKELAREYLKIVFLCEGSWKENRKNPRIQINFAKEESLLSDGIRFMEDLREMLLKFGIRTTPCSVTGRRIRKRDRKISRDIRFRIITEDNHKFIKQISWLK